MLGQRVSTKGDSFGHVIPLLKILPWYHVVCIKLEIHSLI